MIDQLSLFQQESEQKVDDIRTEKQITRKVSYDAGALISGSKKELAALRKAFTEKNSLSVLDEIENISAVVAAELVNKHELFKAFSLEKEKELGTEPAVARAKQLLIQRVTLTPAGDSKEERQQFMKATLYVLKQMESVHEWDDLGTFLNELARLIQDEKYRAGYFVEQINNYQAQLECISDESEEWKSIHSKITRYEKRIKDIQYAREIGLSTLGKKFVNLFKSKSSYRSTLTNAAKVQSWEELLEKKEKKVSSARKPVWERTLPERPDRRGGAQSTIQKPEELISFFEFQGVQFGHYVEDTKGMEHLLRSSEAMMDLAEILGLSYTSISLNGTLSMAYGARGSGKALAHYEPLSKVINMTKEKGSLGVFAHEWFHALDNHLFDLSYESKNGKRGYATEPDSLGENFDFLLKVLFDELVDTMKKGKSVSYYENTNKPGDRWRGIHFKTLYSRYNGDLFKVMEHRIAEIKENLEGRIKFYSSYYSAGSNEIEKLNKKAEREIKQFALALSWYHEQQTGERVEQIPYPSEMSHYLQASLILDRGKMGKYWSSNIELAARAFESYIQDKLKESGRVSDYLVAGTRDGMAFPMGEERERINQKIDQIMKMIKELQLI